MAELNQRSPLPDVARDERPAIALPLEWVGMRGIALPLQLDSGKTVAASAEVAVDLPDPHAKGIHMSRLYLLLDTFRSARDSHPSPCTNCCASCAKAMRLHSPARALRLDFACCSTRGTG
ncbi:GTP cyclohydrolase, FolE2/MptA family, partial [Herbaspirillum sp. B65]|uniref:GTP cyclohydrolase, FolE2/MptA family n=1 Tax=Herbaspirillum sp. B65 TaxID=137708 RepID=UPI00209067AC